MKTANVFLTKSQHKGLVVKIGDLGVAKLLGTNNAFADTMIGTPYYLSPEIVQDLPYNGKARIYIYIHIKHDVYDLISVVYAVNKIK
jgi:serine/threonine protein kinase